MTKVETCNGEHLDVAPYFFTIKEPTLTPLANTFSSFRATIPLRVNTTASTERIDQAFYEIRRVVKNGGTGEFSYSPHIAGFIKEYGMGQILACSSLEKAVSQVFVATMAFILKRSQFEITSVSECADSQGDFRYLVKVNKDLKRYE